MSEMVERVGRALAEQEGYAYDPLPYDARARAAIEAMRHYTYDMERAGMGAMDRGDPFERIWTRAIDAALTPAKADEAG